MRLDRYLCETGFGTRSEVKKIIKQGRVLINNICIKSADFHLSPDETFVSVDGKEVKYRKFIYLMMNKPSGYVSATWDKKLPTVIDLLPEEYLHFEPFPVGRLDIDTEGLLLLTNNGELAHKLLSPKNHIPKTYIAQLEKKPKESDKDLFQKGIDLGDFVTLPSSLEILSESEPYFAKITIFEGKFHQVKRMFESTENKVLYLKRLKMKNLELNDSLKTGEIRELFEDEIEELLK